MLSQCLTDIQKRVQAACYRAGRRSTDVLILAVTKTMPPERINEAIGLGVGAIGENRVQEYLGKRARLRPHEFHFIGHLQRNKVRQILPYCAWIHSVDSVRLAEEISVRARAAGRRIPVLIEVNTSGEESKEGVDELMVPEMSDYLVSATGLDFRGFMTLAAPTEIPEQARFSFQMLRRILDETRSRHPGLAIDQLSMGMSSDFEIAVEEGSTMIRVGTALFGDRDTGD